MGNANGKASESAPVDSSLTSIEKVFLDNHLINGTNENDVAAVQRYLQNGANVNGLFLSLRQRRFIDASTPLTMACSSVGAPDRSNGYAEDKLTIVRILLKAGADARWKDSSTGTSALVHACHKGYLSIVETLLNHDNGLLKIENNRGMTPLFFASRHADIVQLLLERGADVRATDAIGRTALMAASAKGSLESLRLLLKSGSGLEARDIRQRTAVHYAASEGPFEGVRYLIVEHNANMLAVDKYGDTPFDVSTRGYHYTSPNVADNLLQLYGSKVTQDHGRHAFHTILCPAEYLFVEDDGFHAPLLPLRIRTPLGKLQLEHLRTLLQSLDVESIRNQDDSGKLPIHIACQANAPVEVLAMLVEMDPATLQIADHSGSLPIHLLCSSSTTPTEYASVCYLVEQGGAGTLAARNHNGALPLHNLLASTNPSLRTVQYLIQSFPKAVTVRTKEGHYPFMVAACEGSSASLSVIYEIVRANPNFIFQNED